MSALGLRKERHAGLNRLEAFPLSIHLFVKAPGVDHVEKKTTFLEAISDINVHNAFQHKRQLHGPKIYVRRKTGSTGKGPV